MIGNPNPWFSHDANDWLSMNIQKDWDVFEYGSGSSTIWLMNRVRSIVSVEHDKTWYELISRCTGPKLKIFLEERPYNKTIDQYPDKSFDLIIVDGRDRVRCAQSALNKAKPGGYFIIDDSQREYYQPAIKDIELRGWELIPDLKPGGRDDAQRLTKIWKVV